MKEKQNRRLERRERKANVGPRPVGEDPDLAGMQPGPQPRPEWFDLPADEDVSVDEESDKGKS